MTFEQLRNALEKIEVACFNLSLNDRRNLEVLIELKENLINMKEGFLHLNFTYCTNIEELEWIRFKLLENTANINIALNEAHGQDIKGELEKLERIYQIAM